ncbi:MAG: 4Fe-4S binding protein [Promethearchaeota archaeon]
MSEEQLWYKAARTVAKAGQMPMPINENLIELLQIIMTEPQAQFIIKVFNRKPSLSIDQVKEKIDLDDTSLNTMLNDLMDGGIVVGTTSRRTGIKVYRLLGPFPGMFEYTLNRGETGEKQKKLAKAFDKLFRGMSEVTQKNYETVVKGFKNFPPVTRIVPVEEKIEELPEEQILPYEEVSKIIDKYEDIAYTHCYCRHEKDLLDDPCKITQERTNCLLFGKSAQFVIEHKFGEPIGKDEAKRILKLSEDEGLVHKAFHVHLKPELEEEAICNCCKCCCGIFQMYYGGISPYHCYTSYLAQVNDSECIGCGTCVEKCPMEAIDLEDTIAVVDINKCIGCGVCAHHCPESAINLKRTGNREVYVPPPKITTN